MKFRLSTTTMMVFFSTSPTTRAFQVGRGVGRININTNTNTLHQHQFIKQLHRQTQSQSVQLSATSKTEIQWQTRQKCWRPTIQDVERISWGKPAKKKGTGSRGVPHRLNHDDERQLFDQARRKGFLEITGSGWRSQRREAPLINTYRSLCDARGQVCIVLHKGNTGLDDELVIDLSPLRLPDTFEALAGDIVSLMDHPVENVNFDLEAPDEIISEDDDDDDDEEEAIVDVDEEASLAAWNDRPIYQLKPYCISWKTDRSEGKTMGKKLATVFKTAEAKASKSRKPNHVKHGKNRKSGGYGIG